MADSDIIFEKKENTDSDLDEKMETLRACLRELGSVAVAFSSGVDSTFLLKTAHDVLGDNVIAVTAQSCTFPRRERDEAVAFCKKEGIRHILVQSEELEIEGFSDNPVNRCYLCKHELFEKILKVAERSHVQYVAEGSNMDDLGDFRPGLRAISELHIKSPLRYAKMTKRDIRELSRRLGLPTAEKQSFACLSSRFVYGEKITREKLSRVDRAEQLLMDLGFHQLRVRIHGNIARIEILPDEFQKLLQVREEVVSKLTEYGFAYVTMDLKGYRTGSMNETLTQEQKTDAGSNAAGMKDPG